MNLKIFQILCRMKILAFILAMTPVASAASLTAEKRKMNATPQLKCKQTYADFYRPDDLDFRVVFGYKDARPARLVTDRYERINFIQRLLKIGFIRDANDDELLEFAFIAPGGATKRIHLRVVDSSVGPDDEVNRLNPFQRWKSGHARESFLEGVEKGNTVLYIGHSRKEGGPDFEPPHCVADGHIAYTWYEKSKPGLRDLQKTLRSSRQGKRLIGLLSCDSGQHFSREVKRLNPHLGLISNASVLYYTESIEDGVQILQHLTELKCESGFLPSGTVMTGFFK